MCRLKSVFLAGGHCDVETLKWAKETFKKPVYDHWWQTGVPYIHLFVWINGTTNALMILSVLVMCSYTQHGVIDKSHLQSPALRSRRRSRASRAKPNARRRQAAPVAQCPDTTVCSLLTLPSFFLPALYSHASASLSSSSVSLFVSLTRTCQRRGESLQSHKPKLKPKGVLFCSPQMRSLTKVQISEYAWECPPPR